MKLLVRLARRDVKLVLRLGLGRLERAREDAHFGVANFLGHLRVRDVLVDDDALDQLRLLEAAARLALELDHVKIHVVAIEVGDREHRVHRNLRHLALVNVDDL